MTLGVALLAGAVASVASQPAAATANAQLERVGAVTLGLGEDSLYSAVSDGTHAYFGTNTVPGRVVKVNLATLARVDAVTLETGENGLVSVVSDGTYAYFGTDTVPGRVVKVNLATMERVGAVTLAAGEDRLVSAVSDGTHAYFGVGAVGQVVKVQLSGATCAEGVCGGMARVGAVTLEAGENVLRSAVSDGTYAYFGTDDPPPNTSPARVVKVNLATLARVGAVTLETGEDRLFSAVSDGTHAYFGTFTSPGQVVKVNLATMTRVGAVTLGTEEKFLTSAVSDGTHAYFGTNTEPGRVVKVNLATMTRVDAVTLGDGEDRLYSAVSDGTHAYFGTNDLFISTGVRSIVVKVRFASERRSVPVSLLAVSCDVVQVQVGQSVTCTVTGGDSGIDILWRAAYNPVFAQAGVTLDDSGTGMFSFVVPAAALGEELTVELVEWLVPISLGVVGGVVPTSIPSGGGPVPVPMEVFMLAALAGGLALRRMSTVSLRG